jgi:hypothetical protein
MLHVIRKINGTVALAVDSALFHGKHIAPLVIVENDRYQVRYRNVGESLMDWQKEWKECAMTAEGVLILNPLSTVHELMVQYRKGDDWVDAMAVEYSYTQCQIKDCRAQDGDVLMLVNQDDIVIRAQWKSGYAYIAPPSFHAFLWKLSDFHVAGHPECRVISWHNLCQASDTLFLASSGHPANVARFTNAVSHS